MLFLIKMRMATNELICRYIEVIKTSIITVFLAIYNSEIRESLTDVSKTLAVQVK